MSIDEQINEPLRRSPFFYRPVCLLSTVYITVTALSLFSYALSVAVSLALWALYSGVCFLKKRSFSVILPWLLLITLVIALFNTGLYSAERNDVRRVAGLDGAAVGNYGDDGEETELHSVKVKVISEYYCERFGSSYKVRLLEIDGKKMHGNAVIEADQPLNLLPYDVVVCRAELSEYQFNSVNHGELYSVSEDINLLCEAVDSVEVLFCSRFDLGYYAHKLRSVMISGISDVLSHRSAVFASALLFGESSGLSDELSRDISAVGISHLFAVSGVHLSTLAGALVIFMRKRRYSKRLIAVPMFIFGLFYAWLCGSSMSVLRAALMLTFSALVLLIGYRPDPLNSLFSSVAVICFFVPSSALDIGLLLSFTSTLGILISQGLFCKKQNDIGTTRKRSSKSARRSMFKSFIRKVLSNLLTSVSAILFTLPLIALYFGETSVVGVFMNAIISPLVTPSLLIGFLIAVFSRIPLVNKLLAFSFDLLYRAIYFCVSSVAGAFNTSVSLRYPFVIYLMLMCGSAYVFIRICGIKKRLAAFAPLLAFVVLFSICLGFYRVFWENDCQIMTVSVGDNECLAVNVKGNTVICDISDGSKTVAATAVDAVKRRFYVTEIDAYVLTHYHSRHIATIGTVLRNNYVSNIYLPYPDTDTERSVANSLEKLANSYGCTSHFYNSDIELFGVSICAERGVVSRSTHPAVYVMFESVDLSFLYIGSALSDSELYSDVMKYSFYSDCIYLGAHGPSQKTVTALPVVAAGAEIFVSAGNSVDGATADTNVLEADNDGVCIQVFSPQNQTQRSIKNGEVYKKAYSVDNRDHCSFGVESCLCYYVRRKRILGIQVE